MAEVKAISSEVRWLEANKIKVFKVNGALTVLTIKDECSYPNVIIRAAFPLTDISHYIEFFDAADKEIGILKDLKAVDEESQRIIKEELQKRYFAPKILKINSIKQEFGLSYWQVETDKGSREFVMRNLQENAQELSVGRWLFIDVDGNRYEVADVSKLDVHSISLLMRVL